MKRKTIFPLAVITAAIFLIACSKLDNGEPDLTPINISITTVTSQAIESSNDFGIGLFTRVAETESDNLMISPLSASTALTMLLNGCGGDTYTQLQETLDYPAGLTIGDINEAYQSLIGQLLKADPKVKLALANAIFYRNGFAVKQPFLSTMSEDYEATVEALNFATPAALNTINKWASDNTSGKVPKVLDEIDPSAVMFIMNALYFKGNWSFRFDKAGTMDRPFYPDGGSAVNVSIMKSEVGAKIISGDDYSALEMPYGRSNFTMVVIVPAATLAKFNSTFTPQKWNSITGAFDNTDGFEKVSVYMPKFKFSYEKYLNDQLNGMGMVDAFIPGRANLSGITDADVYVDFVKQDTFIEVDEEGTEAAAVTTIGIREYANPGPREFLADKPFIFAIRERTTNTLLFIGQVMNP